MDEPLKITLERVFRAFTDELLSHPTRLKVTLTPGARGCELAARPWSFTDKGKLIGGKAENHRAMQCVLSMVAARREQACRYLILPHDNDQQDSFSPFEENAAWKPDRARRVLVVALAAMFASAELSHASGNGATTFTAVVREPNDERLALVEWALNRLLHSIGNAQGRKLFFKFRSVK